jgi:excisionase family DNA binding protein
MWDVSVHEAAKIIGCSESRVYQYVRSGRLPARKFGKNTLALPIDEVQNFRRVPAGRQGEAPPWRRYRNQARLLVTTIDVRVCPGMQEEMQKKFNTIENEAYTYTFTKTIARYISKRGETIRIMLIWKDTEMPDDTTRQQDLHLFQQAFADILDWETAEYSLDDVVVHT